MWYEVDAEFPGRWQRPSLGAVAASFFPFAVATSLAILGSELRENLDLYRTLYTMGVAMLLTLPALFVYALGIDRPETRNLWRLFWTFALIAYLIHLGWSLLYLDKLSYLQGSGPLLAVVAHYGIALTVLNVLITLWWACDVALAWTGLRVPWVAWQRLAIQGLVVVGCLVAALPAADNHTTPLAYAMVAVVLLGLICRFFTVAPVRDWRPSW